jgi:dolichol kinase
MSRASLPELQQQRLGGTAHPPVSTFPWRLPGIHWFVDRLGICECRRRLLHMLPGLLPIFLCVVPHADPWGAPLLGAMIGLSMTVVAIAFLRESDFARPDETLWHHSVIGYAVPVLSMLILLPGKSELGLMTLGILAFGDGSAALGGKLIGGYRLPWNRRKTWAGLFSFVVAGTIVASFNYWIDAQPAVPIGIALSIGGAAALAGAIVESLPIRSHDNLRVGATAAMTGLLMHIMLLGW